jgi:hypothetical protein
MNPRRTGRPLLNHKGARTGRVLRYRTSARTRRGWRTVVVWVGELWG